jgi:type IV pilus assembly protein PilA
MQQQRGFSLIELLIVVAVILIIASIAVPSLIHSRIAANEASAVYSIRTINTAQITYQATYPRIGYASSLQYLGGPLGGGSPTSSNADILDWVLGCSTTVCPKSGYNFRVSNAVGDPVSTYDVWAVPQSVGNTGQRTFCSNNMQPVLYDPNGGPAGSTDCVVTVQ